MAQAPGQPGDPVLRARLLCKTYGSGEAAVHALRDVDLDVARGEDCLAAIAGMKMDRAAYASWHFCERAT